MNFLGRRFLVTGAAGGIGEATVRTLLALGAAVTLVDVRQDALTTLRTLLPTDADIRVHQSTLGDGAECMGALEVAGNPLHGMIHLAGDFVADPVDVLDTTVWDATLATHARAGYLLSRAFERYHDGTEADPARIVLMSSLAYRRGSFDHIAYSAGKAAVVGIVRGLARRYAPTILVNGVAPGIITTRMPAEIVAQRGAVLLQEIPLRRFGRAEEVASVIAFLCGAASSYISGQIINIDGGTINS